MLVLGTYWPAKAVAGAEGSPSTGAAARAPTPDVAPGAGRAQLSHSDTPCVQYQGLAAIDVMAQCRQTAVMVHLPSSPNASKHTILQHEARVHFLSALLRPVTPAMVWQK